jgi:nitroreductase
MPMDVFTAIKERRSIRDFQKKSLSENEIKKLVAALIAAPSAGNLQSRKFYFVRDQEKKIELARAALGQRFIADAPLVMVACADSNIMGRYGERGLNLYSIQDAAVSVMGMMLAAWEMGLGTVWVGAFREEEARRALNIPRNLRPVAIVPVGYPARIPRPTPRVSPAEAVIYI